MILDKVEIAGYKRLLKASAFVGRRTVALVGPNEAGKTSVLSALRLFDNLEPVSPQAFSRSDRERQRESNEDIVVLWFELDAAQRKVLADLPLLVLPTHYRRHKEVGGAIKYSFYPDPVVSEAPLDSLESSWDEVLAIIHKQPDLEGPVALEGLDGSESLDEDLQAMASFFNKEEFDQDAWERLQTALRRVDEVKLSRKSQTALRAVFEFDKWGRADRDLAAILLSALDIKNPSFAMFGERERAIQSEYNIDAEETSQSAALANLLEIGGVSLEKFRANRADRAYMSELIDVSKRNLQEFFETRWSQEKITVGLDIDGDNLRVTVKDLREGSVGWLDITDRSDGLRMFVALATFLSRRGDLVPPILLIDEAEQHLHLNAQADLVRMLQNLDEIQQVIYTTHSPGCLPADLGNGVRFVEPGKHGTSIIRHDFWSLQNDNHVGFNPLLIVMGAGAAAFSGLRSALFVEGASDMLLLPTLLKLAIGATELDYQVAPGVAVASKSDMATLDLAASRVGFLVDGDDAGRAWGAQLRESGTPQQRIKLLPEGVALEDLFEPDFYVGAINDMLQSSGKTFSFNGSETGPIKGSITDWAVTQKIKMPGAVAVSEYILGGHENGTRPIRLNPTHAKWLGQLHRWAQKTLVDGA